MKSFGVITVTLSLISCTVLLTLGTLASIQFEQNCKGHLKRAADANTINLAREELKTSVGYIESQGLTTGSTHVVYSTPSTDLEFWYKNLRASLDELETFPEDADHLTSSNQLMKLRETLLDQGEKRSRVTVPRNIHVFPYQVPYRLLGTGSVLGLMVGSIATLAVFEEHERRCGK